MALFAPSLGACLETQAAPDAWPKGKPPVARFAPKTTTASTAQTKAQPARSLKDQFTLEALAPKARRTAKTRPHNQNEQALAQQVSDFFGKGRQLRALIETDKPIYQPGHTIWTRAIFLRQQANTPLKQRGAALFQLIDPRGRVHQKKRAEVKDGHAFIDFSLGKDLVGGEYTLRVEHLLWPELKSEHKITVSVYQAPRIKKKLDFLRKTYGAGEEVQAFFSIKRATGEPLRAHNVRMIAQLDGKEYKRWEAKTDDKGEAILSLVLPQTLETDDGLLNVLIEEGGVTESIARPLPLVVKRLNVAFFPEGGHSALGLTNRIYLAARKKIDNKPFDLAGDIRDDRGNTVATVKTFHDGMGRFLYAPKKGRSYHLHITQPSGITQAFPLPEARSLGFSFQIHDDPTAQQNDLSLTVHSKRPQRITLLGIQHESVVAHTSYKLSRGTQKLRLPLKKQWRGILRLTAFDSKDIPVAERLIFRRYGKDLTIQIQPNQASYPLRATASATLRVTNPDGQPIPNAILGASVVDDTVLNFADDHEPQFLAQRFLTTQLTGKIHKPNFYFDPKEKKAPYALDFVMATHGWRAFTWQHVKNPTFLPAQRPLSSLAIYTQPMPQPEYRRHLFRRRFDQPQAAGRPARPVMPMAPPPVMAPQPAPPPVAEPAKMQPANPQPNNQDDGAAVRQERPKQPAPVAVVRPPAQDPAPEKKKAEQDREAPAKDIAPRADIVAIARKPVANFRARRGRPRRGRRAMIRQQHIYIYHRIQFSAQSATVLPQYQYALQYIANTMRNYPKIQLCIAGHTNPQEANDPNTHQALAQKRAQNIEKALRNKGIDPQRLFIGVFGPAQPLYNSAYNKHYAAYNQRVDFRIGEANCPTSYPNYGFARARIFPTQFYKEKELPTLRTDFRETLYWNPKIRTNAQGEATIRFGLNDNATSFRIRVSGIGGGGIGQKEHVISAVKPFFLSVKAPLEVSADDALALPLTLENRTKRTLKVRVTSVFSPAIKLLEDPTPATVTLRPKQSKTFFYPARVIASHGTASLQFTAKGSGLEDSFSHTIQIYPRGFPFQISQGGLLKNEQEKTITFTLPEDIRRASPITTLSFQVSTLAHLTQSLASMLREPSGCFEQTSSTNYPNVMIVNFLKQQGFQEPQIMQRAQALLDRGYKRLTQFETKQKGFEWFGHSPGHEALTAYGLLQFNDMRAIYPQLDNQMVQRTQGWLRAKRTNQGGYQRNARALDTFGRAPSDITDAYITFARAEANEGNLRTELRHVQQLTQQPAGKQDPYLLALATASALKINGPKNAQARKLLRRLLATQSPDGSFQGSRISITSSSGYNLHIETTALAILAMLKAKPLPESALQRAIQWLMKNQRFGGYGATQATILALRAIMAYQNNFPSKPGNGRITAVLNGQQLEEQSFSQNQLAAVKFADFGKALRPGKNTLTLRLKSPRSIPFAFDLQYYTFSPNSSETVPLSLQTKLNKRRARMGETIRLTATLRNTTERGLPMTLARLNFPGALEPQLWQLKALKEKKLVDFYETRPRELILYWRSLAPKFKTTLQLDLVARVTGNYNSAPSRTYLYYTNDQIFWTPPLSTSVIP